MEENTAYLNKIGRLVNSVSELKPGDIVGFSHYFHTNSSDVRLYYVEKVTLKPSPPFLSTPKPRVKFKFPHIGLVIINGEVFRHYIHTPMPGSECMISWTGPEITENDEEEEKEEIFPLYLITDERYKKLGSLIPEVEVPSWGILAQTTYGENLIYEFVNNIKEDINKSRELYEKIIAESVKIV